MTPRRIIRTSIDGSNSYISSSGTSAVSRCFIITPLYICNWNGSIGNIGQTVTGTTPSFRYTSELYTYIDGILPNDSNVPSVVSQILCDELSVSSGINIYFHCRMEVADETIQPMEPQPVSHRIPTIDTFNENYGIWIPATSAIRRTPYSKLQNKRENIETNCPPLDYIPVGAKASGAITP